MRVPVLLSGQRAQSEAHPDSLESRSARNRNARRADGATATAFPCRHGIWKTPIQRNREGHVYPRFTLNTYLAATQQPLLRPVHEPSMSPMPHLRHCFPLDRNAVGLEATVKRS